MEKVQQKIFSQMVVKNGHESHGKEKITCKQLQDLGDTSLMFPKLLYTPNMIPIGSMGLVYLPTFGWLLW